MCRREDRSRRHGDGQGLPFAAMSDDTNDDRRARGLARMGEVYSFEVSDGPGDFFGELSLLDKEPRNASVVAVEPTTCLALAAWDFDTLLDREPRFTLAILRVVARRLRRATHDLRH